MSSEVKDRGGGLLSPPISRSTAVASDWVDMVSADRVNAVTFLESDLADFFYFTADAWTVDVRGDGGTKISPHTF